MSNPGPLAARQVDTARAAAAAVTVDYEVLPSPVSVRDALAAGSCQVRPRPSVVVVLGLLLPPRTGCSPVSPSFPIKSTSTLESQAALATVDEGGQLLVQSSTQHPSETQEVLTHVLNRPLHEVTVQSLRMGGGFGGKEMPSHGFAAIAALGTLLTGRPARVRSPRNRCGLCLKVRPR
ncbi:molybdopterin-dependent oxidoreductase [Arthrobacter alpinus]|nr:molybdopterin-dependent oxidoreductase [Arthrobacter alpinus]